MLLDCNGIKLEINNRKRAGKSQTKQHIYKLHMGQIRNCKRFKKCLKLSEKEKYNLKFVGYKEISA